MTQGEWLAPVDVQTLGGVKQYVSTYLQRRLVRAGARAAKQAEDRENQARIDYDRFRRAELDALFGSLQPEERASIEATARAAAIPRGRKDGFLAQTFFEIERTRITAERYGARIPPFEQWRTDNLA
jgi:hypothetical protein